MAVVASVALLNYRVDPISVFSGEQRDAALNSRVEQFPHMRLSKPWQLRRLQPRALVVGSSRSGKMPPNHQVWEGYRGYNASVPGMTSREMLRFVEHALAQGEMQKLLIGLDFATYIESDPLVREGFSEARMMQVPGDANSLSFRAQQLSDLRDTLVTSSTLGKSLLALAGGRNPIRIYFPDGTWRNNSSLLTGQPGFVYVGRNNVAREAGRKPGLAENLENLSRILDLAYREGLDTRIVLTPLHVFMYRVWNELGRAVEWEAFHRGVLRVNHELALSHRVDPFPVLGFNTLAGIVDEPIQRRGQAGESWFMDGVHYSAPLGQLMMGATWGEGEAGAVYLQDSNLIGYLDEINRLSASFEQNNTELVERLLARIGLGSALSRGEPPSPSR